YLPISGTCDDGNACNMNDACEAGQCTSGTRVSCVDQNPCTIDSCDPHAGCVHKLVANCWVLVDREAVLARADGELQGRSVTCRAPRCQAADDGALLMRGDGSYRFVTPQPQCTAQRTTTPAEVGTLRPAGRGRLRLRPSNRDAIRHALKLCTGRGIS